MLKINVCVEGSNDWLFGDLSRGFERTHIEGIEVIASEAPIQDAGGWIFIRTDEAATSPDFSRTVVCIHDLYNHDGMYEPGQPRRQALQAKGIVLCHPHQRQILEQAGIDLSNASVLERPLGALREFTVRRNPPGKKFRVGWVGREHPRKRTAWFAEALRCFAAASKAPVLSCQAKDVVAVLIGKDLVSLRQRLESDGICCEYFDRSQVSIGDYPGLYQQLDCVAITSSTEAGPLPLFEALATGVPVISTPVGWAPWLASQAPNFVFLADCPNDIAGHLETIRSRREELFVSRFEIAAAVENYRLDDWFHEVLRLASGLCQGKIETTCRAWPFSVQRQG
ncbi:MAG TPA: glycosyltransferase family 4 protein [Candidatus Angelobacter sp.]|nr:glycosyltransferase family 4 protein [Candidatus Angelobacter sp.]